MRKSNYDKYPVVQISNSPDGCARGWSAIGKQLSQAIHARNSGNTVLAIECYHGVLEDELLSALTHELQPAIIIRAEDAMFPSERIDQIMAPDVTDDPVFGHLTHLQLADLFDPVKVAKIRGTVAATGDSLVLVYGVGATLVATADLLIYADLGRWEIQRRFRENLVSNLGVENKSLKWSLQYKRAFFVDWRVCDRHKKRLMAQWDYVLDTNVPNDPKLAGGEAVRDALRQTARRPFRVVPFFDPAPWGGQWMKEACDLDRSVNNFGWCFDCVPEENSLLLQFGDIRIELPSIDLVFYQPRELLGDAVHGRFGDEFPIRFDFLDTIGGGNLSLQVHPLTEYIQEHFGMHYTQDESYYLLDTDASACVYLGLRDGINRDEMVDDLRKARMGEAAFDADKYVNRWPAKKHDHFLIPAGTIHCSGSGSMVLEISATPYIFTFKMWDWGRLGLDGLPRPIHLDHALPNIQWDRTTEWTKNNLVNRVQPIARGENWREEQTGLHSREFIVTRRHWFTDIVYHDTKGGVNVLNLIEGDEAIVESPSGIFPPMIVHYAETFIVPAAAGVYSIRPFGQSVGRECATIKAFVRT